MQTCEAHHLRRNGVGEPEARSEVAAVRGTFDTTFDTALEWRRRVNQARLDAGADVNTRDAAGTGAVWATAAVPDQKILARPVLSTTGLSTSPATPPEEKI